MYQLPRLQLQATPLAAEGSTYAVSEHIVATQPEISQLLYVTN